MSVLIKNMSMPDNCNKCVFCVNGFTDAAPMYECAASGDDMTSVLFDDHGRPFDFRPDWCPLIEVKTPHGRLIDADELKTAFPTCDNSKDIKVASVRATINHMQTIIEAERSEE
jgi:hypothetical protein